MLRSVEIIMIVDSQWKLNDGGLVDAMYLRGVIRMCLGQYSESVMYLIRQAFYFRRSEQDRLRDAIVSAIARLIIRLRRRSHGGRYTSQMFAARQ